MQISAETTQKKTILKPKHEQVVINYIENGGNKVKAYRDAGYSPNGADGASQRLFQRPDIRARIREIESETRTILAEKFNVTRDRILAERARIAFFRTDMLYHPDGTLKKPEEWGEDVAAVISSVKVREVFEFDNGKKVKVGDVVEVRTHSKTACLEALEKIEGMYEKDNEQRRPYEQLSDDELVAKVREMEKKIRVN